MSLEAHARLSPHLQGIAEGLGSLLDELAGEHVLFCLLTFGDGEDGRAQYISNADRAGVIKSLEELLQRWKETGSDDGPYHVFRKAN